MLAAAGFNFSLLLRWFAELLRVLLLILCRHLAPPHPSGAQNKFFTDDEVPVVLFLTPLIKHQPGA